MYLCGCCICVYVCVYGNKFVLLFYNLEIISVIFLGYFVFINNIVNEFIVYEVFYFF